jgi:hypothetical protein
MKKVILTVKIADQKSYFVGTIKLAVPEQLIPEVIAKLRANQVNTKGYQVEESGITTTGSAIDVLYQASTVFADVLSLDFRAQAEKAEEEARIALETGPTFN